VKVLRATRQSRRFTHIMSTAALPQRPDRGCAGMKVGVISLWTIGEVSNLIQIFLIGLCT